MGLVGITGFAAAGVLLGVAIATGGMGVEGVGGVGASGAETVLGGSSGAARLGLCTGESIFAACFSADGATGSCFAATVGAATCLSACDCGVAVGTGVSTVAQPEIANTAKTTKFLVRMFSLALNEIS